MKMKGFTLIELIIVISVIGIVSVIAPVGIDWWLSETRLTEARDKLLADLEFVRRQSITGEPHGIFFYTNKYEIRHLDDTNDNFVRDAGESAFLFPGSDGTIELMSDVTIAWNSCSGGNELWFDRKGIPRCNNWALGMGTITITKDSRTKGLVINRTGKIKYE
jgi:prepilin-type N-terminal cleavage/methylation domain-containing protein